MKSKELRMCILAAAMGFHAGAFAQEEGTIKYRQAIMKAVAGHATAIAQIAHGGVPHMDHLQSHISALSVVSKQVTAAFSDETISEDPPTRAKPKIWQKWSEFEEKAAHMEKAVTDVARASEGGDLEAIAARLDPLWESCKGCHKPFRAKNN